MRPTDLHGTERNRFPLPVGHWPSTERRKRRRLFIFGLLLGFALGLNVTWLVVGGAIP